jgi:hypothetical protein
VQVPTKTGQTWLLDHMQPRATTRPRSGLVFRRLPGMRQPVWLRLPPKLAKVWSSNPEKPATEPDLDHCTTRPWLRLPSFSWCVVVGCLAQKYFSDHQRLDQTGCNLCKGLRLVCLMCIVLFCSNIVLFPIYYTFCTTFNNS